MLALGKIEDGGFIVHCQVGVIKILKIRGFWICIRCWVSGEVRKGFDCIGLGQGRR